MLVGEVRARLSGLWPLVVAEQTARQRITDVEASSWVFVWPLRTEGQLSDSLPLCVHLYTG